jgi:ribose transport system permease protein
MTTTTPDQLAAPDAYEHPPLGTRVASALSPAKIGGVYVLVIMIIVFSIWEPDTFPEADTVRQILNTNAITAMAALTFVIPLSAGVFDISIPSTMTLAGVMSTYAIVNSGQSVFVGILIALGVSLLVGILNGIVVVVLQIESLIGTLATSFLIGSLVVWRTGSRNISGPELAGGFQDIAQTSWLFDLTLPVYYALVLAIVLWYVLEHTATGRRIYATGFNLDATRLASVRTERIRFGSLIAAAFLAGITGIVLASNIGSGSSTAGGSYLLPAIAAVFLGATQLKNGRFNAWGTIIAVVLLGTLVTGLGLAEVGQWVQQFAIGVVLIAALALTGFQVRRAGSEARRARAASRAAQAAPDQPAAEPT